MSEFFVVATPIGNLSDITFRAVETLKICDIILCEDSRIANRLLTKYHIENKKLVLYNENSDQKTRENILKMLKEGLDVALISDAGTPLISDPGYKLIDLLKRNQIKVTPIPGASSLVTALSASGIATDKFIFLGFLPNSSIKRQNFLKNLPKEYNFVFFEGPSRVFDSLVDLLNIFGEVKVSVARELTKIHEEVITDNISNIIQYFQQNPQKIRGEFVIMVEKSNKKGISEQELRQEIKKALKSGQKIKEISQNLSQIHGLNRKIVYQMALDCD